jgi:hypothetical protein
VDDPKSV